MTLMFMLFFHIVREFYSCPLYRAIRELGLACLSMIHLVITYYNWNWCDC
jgi:hypothetical protein